MKRWLTMMVLAVGAILLTAGGLWAAAADTDGARGGFRGISWGTPISSLAREGLEELPDVRTQYGAVVSYRRKGDRAVFSGIPVDNITYNFWNGKLYSVCLDIRGFMNYERLLSYCDREFGPRISFMGTSDETLASYEAGDTGYLLTYYVPRVAERRTSVNTGRFFLYSRELDRQMTGYAEALPPAGRERTATPAKGKRAGTQTKTLPPLPPVPPKAAPKAAPPATQAAPPVVMPPPAPPSVVKPLVMAPPVPPPASTVPNVPPPPADHMDHTDHMGHGMSPSPPSPAMPEMPEMPVPPAAPSPR